ncbi:MAG: TetR/AcrR family transcriptional regulator [Bradymonadia bacterium]
MARPRKFERDAALEIAIRLFWTRGYEQTTMSDLRLAMGIGRQSLYSTFGDKEQLFHEAFERYKARAFVWINALLHMPDPGEGLHAYFDKLANGLTDDPDRAGCLIFNTFVEQGAAGPLGQRGVEAFNLAFSETLSRAHEMGMASGSIEEQALSLVSATAGMVALSRGGYSKMQLKGIGRLALAGIGL